MAINFNALPNSSGFESLLVEDGLYILKIEKAEMRKPKATAKSQKEYLSLWYTVKDKDGKELGKMGDMQFDHDAPALQFKLRRFIEALKIPITGAFELSDLTKIVPGKELIAHVTKDDNNGKPKSVVAIFEDKVYYPIEEKTTLFNEGSEINATDAEDDSPFLPEKTDY